MKTRLLCISVLVALIALLAVSCSTLGLRVMPWEREQLADPAMDPDADAIFYAVDDQIYYSREASAGGRGFGGGGCGCN